MTIKRIAAEKWEIRTDMIKVLYGAVAFPIIKYGTLLWYDVADKSMIKRNLLLLLVTRACRTTSTAAMQAIAGAKPMNLEVVEEALLKRVKRNLTTTWGSYEYIDREQFKETFKSEMETIKCYITSKWQAQGESGEQGRETYKYIHQITFAHNNKKWFKPNRYLAYLITGYGPINSTLCKRGLVDSSICSMCGEEEETAQHIIFDCAAYEDFRFNEMEQYRHSRNELVSSERKLEQTNLQEKCLKRKEKNEKRE